MLITILVYSFFKVDAGPKKWHRRFRRVVRVVDGDTVQVLTDGKMQKVRLNGIGAPESGQPFGQHSKQNLLNWPHRNKRKSSPVAEIVVPAG